MAKKEADVCKCGARCEKMAIGLIVLGILIYLKNIGMIPAQLFWPGIAILAGIIMFLKKDMCCKC
ncbi:hypothetical protein HZC09_04710 [Candidatus Micrarchaeota archaeon]|nr:hypothetical protein [Candidatus Micrarchaeota archaeon]